MKQERLPRQRHRGQRSAQFEKLDVLLDEAMNELHHSPRKALPKIHYARKLAHQHSYTQGLARAFLAEASAERLLSNYDSAITCLQSAISLFTELHDRANLAEAYRNLGSAYIRTGNYQEAQQTLLRAQRIYEHLKDEHRIALITHNLAVIHQRLGHFKEALHGFLESADRFERFGDEANQGAALSNAAVLLEALGDYKSALEYALKAYIRIDKHGNLLHKAAVFNTLASLSLKIGNQADAIEYALKSKFFFEASGEKFGIATSLTMLGELHQLQGDFARAHTFYQDALALRQVFKDRWGIADVLFRIGNLYAQEEKWHEAETTYQESLALFEAGGEKLRQAQVQLALAKLLIQREHFSDAETLLCTALQLATDAQATEDIAALYHELATLYAKTRRYALAYENHIRFHEIETRRKDAERLKEMQHLQIRYEVGRLQDERKFFEQKAAKLEVDIQHKQKELMELTMSLVKKNQFLQTLNSTLGEALSGSPRKRQHKLTHAMQAIESSLRSQESWKLFAAQFSQLHHTFLQTLTDRYPALTPAEVKVATMLRLGLSTKEIAALLYLSERTVESHRQSLRKKLQLGSDLSLQAFLASL
jgi:tetratricopeptide (TPR) repeat protein